jgi:hypothetical protein
MPELRLALSQIMAGALNGDVRLDEGRLALNAATRMIESLQAETRARALAHAIGSQIDKEMPLTIGAFLPQAAIEHESD